MSNHNRDSAVRKNWLKKFNQSVLNNKTPLLGFTVIQLIILSLVIGGGTAAIILNRQQEPVTKDTSPSLPTHVTENTDATQTNANPTATTPQSTTQNNSRTQVTTKSNNTSDVGSSLDQYGCVTNIPSYSQCVSNAKARLCNSQESGPALAFSTATIQARAAYNSVMNDWQSAQYLPTHNPYSEYLDDAQMKFNAIYEPAFTTYSAKIQSLNSQGCSFAYPAHESPGQYL